MLTHQNPAPRHPRRVVVIGASGFLGARLTTRLQSMRVPVLPLSSSELDLSSRDAGSRLAERLRPEDSVAMLAAITADRGNDVPTLMRNLAIGEAFCVALERVPCAHVLYFSSEAVYPLQTKPDRCTTESSCAQPEDLYGLMHRTRELMLTHSVRGPLAVLRPAQVFGLGSTHNTYGPDRLRREAATTGRITLLGGGEETRDFIEVEDLISLSVGALLHRSCGTLNAVTGESVNLRT